MRSLRGDSAGLHLVWRDTLPFVLLVESKALNFNFFGELSIRFYEQYVSTSSQGAKHCSLRTLVLQLCLFLRWLF